MTDNTLELQTPCYRTTFTGLEVVRPSTHQEWDAYGQILRAVDEAKQWAIGDWLVDGKQHYGDGLYKRAGGILNTDDYNYLAQQKRLAELFQISNRLLNLTWKHHREVASIKQIGEHNGKLSLTTEPDNKAMAALLQQAEKENLSTRVLAERVTQYKQRQQEEIRLANEPERYSVILADPAWEYDFSQSDVNKIDNHYLPSSQEQMKRLRVPAAEAAVLFMWATSPKLREALELIVAWGFDYKTCMVWVKDKAGLGYYARQKHELLLIGARGDLGVPEPSTRPESVFLADRGEHSEKPTVVHEMIEMMYPEYRKLEMFARRERQGWDTWGDEVDH